MSAHLSAPELNVLSMVGPVGNNALQAVGIAHEIKSLPTQPIVLCSMGDGTTQQGEVLEAIAEAVRSQLPVLFLVEDNHYSISTRTIGKTFYSLPDGNAESFFGLPIHRVDGSDAMACAKTFGVLVKRMRKCREPVLCVMAVERLTNHTNADDETVYREAAEIHLAKKNADPIAKIREYLMEVGISEPKLAQIDDAIENDVRIAADAALDQAASQDDFNAALYPPKDRIDRILEYRGTDDISDRINMGTAIRSALAARMENDPRISVYGQDIEDPKGDVFGVTRGLSTSYPGRVLNSPLSESTIIGTCIGRALAGGRPVAFIQFADFLPLAFNQLATELSSIAWRTNGKWRAPVVVIAACGGYRPGLGPFHSATHEAIFAHLPGIDVAMPSCAADSAGMLNAALLHERPTMLLYPKALLNDQARSTSPDVDKQIIPLGAARLSRTGTEITIVGWGNTVPLCERVADTLREHDVSAEVIDLRWLSPWDKDMVCESARKTGRLLVIHEDNLTAGFGAEVVATVCESAGRPIACHRVARPDTYTPCHFGNQLAALPSYERILTAASELCGLDLTWESLPQLDAGRQEVMTIGSSPSDETVEVVELYVKEGDRVHIGQVLASLEADKAIIDLASPFAGLVESIHLDVGDSSQVDTPLMTLAVEQSRKRQSQREPQRIAHIKRRLVAAQPNLKTVELRPNKAQTVVIAGLGVVRGKARLNNSELAMHLKAFDSVAGTGDGIFDRTGIESRIVADSTQDALSMATEAAMLALRKVGIGASSLNLIICTTTTPRMVTPSTACQVLQRIAPNADIPAYDLQAACSGYLYALSAAWDYLQSNPSATVLVLTTETMRRVTDINDPSTSPIFADAATATILTTSLKDNGGIAVLHRPIISARGENGAALRVPLPQEGAYIHMDGKKIFVEAVRRMISMLGAACESSKMALTDLDLIVPHQANGRIIEAIRTRLKLPPERVWNEIRFTGNTSSSSIPLALDTIFCQPNSGNRIGLCAFGAGFTFGGAILDRTGCVVERDVQLHFLG